MMINPNVNSSGLIQPPLVRDVLKYDIPNITTIYNHYIFNTTATLEEIEITTHKVNQRMRSVLANNLPYLVLEKDGVLCGFAYADLWMERPAYQHTVESVIFLHAAFTGLGYGTLLYQSLIRQITLSGAHAILAKVALPNPPAIALHKKLGFLEVALFREVGWKFKRWIDLTYWELMTGV